MNYIKNVKCYGYTENDGGYSGTFSWWRRSDKPGWHVVGHVEGFTTLAAYGITDDFGNIVKVPA